MIISHSKEFAFFRTPKTGSSTSQFFLSIACKYPAGDFVSPMPQWGVGHIDMEDEGKKFMRRMVHATPQVALEDGRATLDQLLKYKTFAFIREPFARSISGFYHGFGKRASPEIFDKVLAEKGRDNMLERMNVILAPQKDYFFADGVECIEALQMSDFEPQLRYLLGHVTDFQFPVIIPMNSRGMERDTKFNHEDWLTPSFVDFVETEFGDDIEFYNKVLSNDSFKNS